MLLLSIQHAGRSVVSTFSLPWHLRGGERTLEERCVGLNVLPTWAISQGSEQIRVAVIDTGIWTGHPAIEGCCIGGAWFGSTLVLPEPFRGGVDPFHGTACVSLLAGKGPVQGVAPGCRVVPVGLAQRHSAETLTACLVWAARHAEIVLTPWSSTDRIANDKAVLDAFGKGRGGLGTIWIAPAGRLKQETVSYPACLPECISVESISSEGQVMGHHADVRELDVLAPGCGGKRPLMAIARWSGKSSCLFEEAPFPGSSGSASLVAGGVALLLSVAPNLTAEDVRRMLSRQFTEQLTSRDLAAARSEQRPIYGFNIGNLMKWLH